MFSAPVGFFFAAVDPEHLSAQIRQRYHRTWTGIYPDPLQTSSKLFYYDTSAYIRERKALNNSDGFDMLELFPSFTTL